MNEDQAKQWLIDNDFYTEGDTGGEYPEAALFVDQDHINIVMALSKEMKK